MREIGRIEDKKAAAVFSNYLYMQGIDNIIKPDAEAGWAVWIYSEDRIPEAKEKLAQFFINPGSPRYLEANKDAEIKKRQDEKEEALSQIKLRKQVGRFERLGINSSGPLTLGLIVLSCIITLLCMFGSNTGFVDLFRISNYVSTSGRFWDGLVEVSRGQVWRLITPIFMHFSIMHIFFNMLWLKNLGSMIENKKGWQLLAVLVIVIGVSSNLAEYAFSGPNFGGMSGVVYGLFGFVWMQWRFNPFSGFYMDRFTVITMIIWFFLCWMGMMGSIANLAHTGGLAIGVIWGYLYAKLVRK
ncbi:MAG: rhomboid family intramembrane serine protease [Armatimonadota bacterium]